MMRTRTIATGAGITGSADCPPAFLQSGNPVPLGLWCCAVSSPVAAPPCSAQSLTHANRSHTHTFTHPWPIHAPASSAPPTLWGHLRVPRLPLRTHRRAPVRPHVCRPCESIWRLCTLASLLQ